jgi:hypothetical protein
MLALFLSTSPIACSDDREATSMTEGSALLRVADESGAVESFDIRTPNGDVYFELDDWGDRCELSIQATTPILADKTDDAEARRVRVLVHVPASKLAEVFAGRAQTVKPAVGFLAGDCTLRYEKNRTPDAFDQYCAVGGAIVVDPLPPKGGTARIGLEAIDLQKTTNRSSKRRLDGTIEAKFRGTVRPYGAKPGNACPGGIGQ